MVGIFFSQAMRSHQGTVCQGHIWQYLVIFVTYITRGMILVNDQQGSGISLRFIVWTRPCLPQRVIVLASFCLLHINSLGKRALQLRNPLLQICLWACLWRTSLMDDECRRAQPTLDGAIPEWWSWVAKAWVVVIWTSHQYHQLTVLTSAIIPNLQAYWGPGLRGIFSFTSDSEFGPVTFRL